MDSDKHSTFVLFFILFFYNFYKLFCIMVLVYNLLLLHTDICLILKIYLLNFSMWTTSLFLCKCASPTMTHVLVYFWPLLHINSMPTDKYSRKPLKITSKHSTVRRHTGLLWSFNSDQTLSGCCLGPETCSSLWGLPGRGNNGSEPLLCAVALLNQTSQRSDWILILLGPP